MSFNKSIVMGNICQPIELRDVNGTSVTTLRLASNERYRSKSSGDMVDDPMYIDVEVWGRQAEVANQYLSKGMPVLIEGKIKQDSWEKDGQKFSKHKIRCENLTLLPRNGGGEDVPSGGGASGTPSDGSNIPF